MTTMTTVKYLAAAAGLALVVAGAARAAEPVVDDKGFPGAFSANAAVTSEYFFRALSQTDDAPALQGRFDYSVALGKSLNGYLGVWGSNVDFNEDASADGATVEIDLYGGLNGEVGATGLGWDAGFIYYAYPGAADNLDYDFVEVQGALSYDFGLASASLSFNYAPDNFGGSGDAFYPKLAIDVPVGKYLTLSAHVAKQWLEKEDVFGQPDYVDWGVGATVNVVGFDLSLAYKDTDIDGDPDGADRAIYLTVSRSF